MKYRSRRRHRIQLIARGLAGQEMRQISTCPCISEQSIRKGDRYQLLRKEEPSVQHHQRSSAREQGIRQRLLMANKQSNIIIISKRKYAIGQEMQYETSKQRIPRQSVMRPRVPEGEDKTQRCRRWIYIQHNAHINPIDI